MTEPVKRGPGRPRKSEPTYTVTKEPASAPPGPIHLEIRAGRVGEQTKIVCSQRVHSYTIDQQPDALTVTGVVTQPTE